MFSENQLFVIACILLLTGFALAKHGWKKNQEFMKYGLHLGNSKYKQREFQAHKHEVAKYVRFYVFLILLGIALLCISLFIVLKIDLHGIN